MTERVTVRKEENIVPAAEENEEGITSQHGETLDEQDDEVLKQDLLSPNAIFQRRWIVVNI
jgi:hypothetical protein